MKWLGWIFAAFVLLMLLVVRHQGQRALVAERKAVDDQLAARRSEVEAVVQRVSASLPAQRERLDAETRKTADLERLVAEIEPRKASLEQSVKDFSGTAEKLRQDRDDATARRNDDKQQIRELQDKITEAETQVSRLRKVLPRVTETTTP